MYTLVRKKKLVFIPRLTELEPTSPWLLVRRAIHCTIVFSTNQLPIGFLSRKGKSVNSPSLYRQTGPGSICNTFDFANADDKLEVDSILDKFTAYSNPRKNITFLRYQFFSYSQSEGQQFDHFVTSLKKRTAGCEFGDFLDSLIKDRLVCGTNDSKLRERYLRESELTLEKAVQLGQDLTL